MSQTFADAAGCPGLDRFGRVKDLHYTKNSGADTVHRYWYAYDAWNRLTSVHELGTLVYEELVKDFDADGKLNPPGGHVIGALLVCFRYDGLGRLIRAERPVPDTGTPGHTLVEDYYYDGVRRLQETTKTIITGSVPEQLAPNGDPATGREYVYGPDYVDEVVAQIDDPGASPTGGDQPRVIFILQDANYNVVALLGLPDPQTGAIPLLAQYSYEPYGGRTHADEPGITADNDNPLGHQGLFFYRLTRDDGYGLVLNAR